MVRLHMMVEGQTEETFVKTMLVEHLGFHNITADARLVETSRKKGKIYRGGMTTYAKMKRDLERWMKEDKNADTRFTTMFDLYKLPQDFPKYGEAKKGTDPYERARILEDAFAEDLGDRRLVPYIQLHEFETLLFSDPRKFDVVFIGEQQALRNLQAARADFSSRN